MSKTWGIKELTDISSRYMVGEVNGIPAWSNGYILETAAIRPFPRRRCKPVRNNEFQTLVDKILVRQLSDAIPTSDSRMVLLQGRVALRINKVWYDYFIRRYPDCIWKVAEQLCSAAVFCKGELVGLVASINYSNKNE